MTDYLLGYSWLSVIYACWIGMSLVGFAIRVSSAIESRQDWIKVAASAERRARNIFVMRAITVSEGYHVAMNGLMVFVSVWGMAHLPDPNPECLPLVPRFVSVSTMIAISAIMAAHAVQARAWRRALSTGTVK